MLRIVLFEPEIPPNTGSIMRLAANTGALLRLVEPLGFELDEPRLRRAGLDYRDLANVEVHGSLEAAVADVPPERCFAFSKFAQRCHSDVTYEIDDALIFGPESRGLPPEVLSAFPDANRVRLPMQAQSRSLNLSNAVSVGVYEAWRQLGYPGSIDFV